MSSCARVETEVGLGRVLGLLGNLDEEDGYTERDVTPIMAEIPGGKPPHERTPAQNLAVLGNMRRSAPGPRSNDGGWMRLIDVGRLDPKAKVML